MPQKNPELKTLMKKLPSGTEVYDIDQIAEQGYFLNIIMSNRGVGKTLGWKFYAMHKFLENGRPSIYMMTTKILMESAKQDFLADIFKPNVWETLTNKEKQFWKDCKVQGSVDKNRCAVYHKDELFIKLVPLTQGSALKGSRRLWNSWLYDEFNLKLQFSKNPTHQFTTLLNTMYDPNNREESESFNIFLFANYITLDNELLWTLKINHPKKSITTKRVAGIPKFVLFICKMFSDEEMKQIEEENKLSKVYQLTKAMGDSHHAFFNKSVYDDSEMVIKYETRFLNINNLVSTIYYGGGHYQIFNTKNFGVVEYHVMRVDKDVVKDYCFGFPNDERVIPKYLNRRHIDEGYLDRTDAVYVLREELSKNNVSFQNITSKNGFIKSIGGGV